MNIQTFQMVAVSLVTLGVLVAFAREWAAPDVIALAALVIALGALDADAVAGLFSNSAPLTIGAMFVLSASLERTGVMGWMARMFSRMAGRSLLTAISVLALMVIPLSAFANNAVAIILTPS
ncbi:MAG: SLC13 family permease [Terrimicrobiaceae bacterium]|jgi:Na+/H+ antiporter NhaD/arsenite permease-like protein|nr:SLC13 family permease [Terrimicrobiaceae bacterium]